MKSFKYAIQGMKDLWKHQHNARIQIFIGLTTLCFSFLLDISKVEWMIVLILIGLVLSFELLNSAIEYLADEVTAEHSTLIGRCKDASAASVLVISTSAALIGLIIFVPKIFHFISHY